MIKTIKINDPITDLIKEQQKNKEKMSVHHYISIDKEFDFEQLANKLGTIDKINLAYQQRNINLWYFWHEGKSSRGFDLTLEREDWIELRNTVCSNRADYEFTNLVARILCEEFEGVAYKDNDDYDEDEAGSQEFVFTSLPLFEANSIQERMENDASVIRTMVEYQKQPITLFGPRRQVHIGNRFIEQHQELSLSAFTEKLKDLILEVNYKLPDWDPTETMKIPAQNEEDRDKTVLPHTNHVDRIIGHYDYIFLIAADEEVILISIDNLIKIKPQEWHLVDEYTMVAPIISPEAFQALIERARAYDEKHILD